MIPRFTARARSARASEALLLSSVFFLSACRVAAGEGEIESERLYARGCSNGPFTLLPNFFAAEPSGDQISLRVQRGNVLQEGSDGIRVVVRDVALIRGDDGGAGLLDQDLKVGLPAGVRPPGEPIVHDPDPPHVSLTLFLNDACDVQNVSLQAVEGTMRFSRLWNGDINATSEEDRLIEGEFDVLVADPRELTFGEEPDPAVSSRVTGHFRFLFERGHPAQPFP